MSDKKHIDRIFQEKLKDFEAIPDKAVWHKIQNKLNQEKAGKKMMPVWWKLAGTAAALILLITVANLIFKDADNSINIVDTEKPEVDINKADKIVNPELNTDKVGVENSLNEESNEFDNTKQDDLKSFSNENSRVVDNNEESENGSDETNTSLNNNKINQLKLQNNNNAIVNSHRSIINRNNTKSNNKINNQQIPSTNNKYLVSNETEQSGEKPETVIKDEKEDISINQNPIPEIDKEQLVENTTEDLNTTEKKTNKDIISNQEKEQQLVVEQEEEKITLTENAIVSNENINEEEKETINRWQINANIAPVYFNSLGKGSSIDSQFIDNPKSGEINTSYGVNVGYVINDKLVLNSGLNTLALSYDTNNVILYQNIGVNQSDLASIRNIKMDNSEITMISASNVGAQQINGILGNNSNAAISQRLNFLEVPLEVDYKLINKKFGLDLTGGFSTFFLTDNEIVSEFDGFNTYIGEATNINDLSFSLNLGFGLDFPFSENISLNIDPMFKYQINTFKNTSGNFKPYIIGVYSGINVKF